MATRRRAAVGGPLRSFGGRGGHAARTRPYAPRRADLHALRRRLDAGVRSVPAAGGAVNALEALADPTRRRIVELLATRERTAGELASELDRKRTRLNSSHVSEF